MRRPITAVCFSAVWLLAAAGWCQSFCAVTGLSEVEASHTDLSLADLLSTNSCPELIRSAARIRLGAPPLAGSARVFAGDQVRALLEQTIRTLPSKSRPVLVRVPERIRVRRGGTRLACVSIEAKVFDAPGAAPAEADCGAAGRIPEDASLALTHRHWDPALRSWVFSARCAHRGDCVPFLIRVRSSDLDEAPVASSFSAGNPGNFQGSLRSAAGTGQRDHDLIVHAGERTSVLWDQDGIRLTMSAICLDSGRVGEIVRARLERSLRIVRAVVLNSHVLQVQS